MPTDRAGLIAPGRLAAPGDSALRGRPHYELSLIGGFRLCEDGVDVPVPAGSQRLIARLALRGQSGRTRLAGALWPDATDLKALATLRTALWRANQAAPGLLHLGADAVMLSDRTDVDVWLLVRSAHELLTFGDDGAETVVSVLRTEGDLLPDWTDEWLVLDRERLRQLRLHGLEALAERYTQRRMFGSAMDAALAALHADPLRESAHRAVIRVHLAEGNVAEARRAFDACSALLRRELGVRPSDWTYALVRGLPSAPRATPAPPADGSRTARG